MFPSRMSYPEGNENYEKESNGKSSESEEQNQTDEDESISESVTRLKKIVIQGNYRSFGTKKSTRNSLGRFKGSIRYRQISGRRKCQGHYKKKIGKKPPEKCLKFVENSVETSKKGKRCRLGGKAKGKPPEEESNEKCDSDEDGDSSYYSRISLGYFQKFIDRSGASTSYQLNESPKTPKPELTNIEKTGCKTSEEMELLELQLWGVASLVTCNEGMKKANPAEGVNPDTF